MRMAVFVSMLLLLVGKAGAQVDVKQAQAVAQIAREACARPAEFGISETVSGQIGGTLNSGAVIRRFGSFGIAAEQRKSTSRYQGLPARDLVTGLTDYNACVRDLMRSIPINFRLGPLPRRDAGIGSPKQSTVQRSPTGARNTVSRAPKQMPAPTAAAIPPVTRMSPGDPPASSAVTNGPLSVQVIRLRRMTQTWGTQPYDSLQIILRIKPSGSAGAYYGAISEYVGSSMPFRTALAGWTISNDLGTVCKFNSSAPGLNFPVQGAADALNFIDKDSRGEALTEGSTSISLATCSPLVAGGAVNIEISLYTFEGTDADCGRYEFGTPQRDKCVKQPWLRRRFIFRDVTFPQWVQDPAG